MGSSLLITYAATQGHTGLSSGQSGLQGPQGGGREEGRAAAGGGWGRGGLLAKTIQEVEHGSCGPGEQWENRAGEKAAQRENGEDTQEHT